MVCDVLTFVNDERVVGPTEELTWQASHALALGGGHCACAGSTGNVCPDLTGEVGQDAEDVGEVEGGAEV
jgi:hypothetical protein